MRAIMAVFAGFFNIYESLNALVAELKTVGFKVPLGIQRRIAVINRVREHLGDPNEEGCFPSNPSRVRISEASNEITEIICLIREVEIDFYRSEVSGLLARCEELLPVLEIQDKVLDLKNQVRITRKYKIDQLPVGQLRKRFAGHIKELRELESRAAAIAVREVISLMGQAEKPVPKKGRSAEKREADRQLRMKMRGQSNGGGGKKQKSKVA